MKFQDDMTIYKELPYLETALLFREHTHFLGLSETS